MSIKINKELFRRFLDGNIIINCQTIREAKDFFEFCNKQGMLWGSGGSLLLGTEWDYFKSETCYRCYDNIKMDYSNIDYCKEHNREIIAYKKIIENNEDTKYKVGLKFIDTEQWKYEILSIAPKLDDCGDQTYFVEITKDNSIYYQAIDDEELDEMDLIKE